MATDNIERQTFRAALLFGADGTVSLFDGNELEIVPRHHMGISFVFDIPLGLLVYDGSRGTFEISAMPNIRIAVDQLHLVVDDGASE